MVIALTPLVETQVHWSRIEVLGVLILAGYAALLWFQRTGILTFLGNAIAFLVFAAVSQTNFGTGGFGLPSPFFLSLAKK